MRSRPLQKTIKKSTALPASSEYRKKGYYLLFGAISILLIAIIYGQSLRFGFTYFDDDAILIRNQQALEKQLNFIQIVTTDAEFQQKKIELYRPLQNLSFWLETKIFGFNSKVFHFSQLLLHFCNVWLLLFFLLLMKVRKNLAFVLSIVFVIHPAFTQTIVWLPSRGDLLLAFTSLSSLILWILFLQHRKPWLLVIHWFFFFLALLSKESAVLLIVLFYLISRSQNIERSRIIKPLVNIAVYCFFIIIYLVLRANAIHPATSGSFGIRALLLNLPTLPETIGAVFFPFRLPVMPSYSLLRSLAGLIVMALLFYVFWKYRKKLSFAAYGGIVWFVLFSIPAMLYRPEWSSYSYDYCLHRSYFPLLGLWWSASAFLTLRWVVNTYIAWISGIVLIILIAFSSFQLAKQFRHSESFYQYAVSTNPKSALAWQNYGNVLQMNSKDSLAEMAYLKALELHPELTDVYYNRGIVYARQKKFDKAINDLNTFRRKNPANTDVLRTLAFVYIDAEKPHESLLLLEAYLKKVPEDVSAWYKLGIVNNILKNYNYAALAFSKVLEKEPEQTKALLLRADAYLLSGNSEKAEQDYRNLLRMDSTYYSAYTNLAYLNIDKGNASEAERYFQLALQREHSVDTWLGMSMVQFMKNNKNASRSYLDSAKKAQPILYKGFEGIEELEKQGYYYTPFQKELLKKLF